MTTPDAPRISDAPLDADLQEAYGDALLVPCLPGDRLRKMIRELQQLRRGRQFLEWQEIATAPDEPKAMFVVRGFDVSLASGAKYTSDPWCVWRDQDGEFARWPHAFAPTHWLRLPPSPAR